MPIELRVAQPKVPWKSVIVSILSESGERWAEGSPWPSVNAINMFGEELQLVELPTKKEAITRLAEVRADLESLGLRDWCDKYDVPWSFVTTLLPVGTGIPLTGLDPCDGGTVNAGRITRRPLFNHRRPNLDQRVQYPDDINAIDPAIWDGQSSSYIAGRSEFSSGNRYGK